MIFFMDSKTFFEEYINREDDTSILEANYIIASRRIRKHSQRDNIATLHNMLFPNSSVFSQDDENEMEARYFDQLEYDAKGFFASIISASIKDNATFIFLNTKKESKIDYLHWIQEYIMMVFQYPVYDYKNYIHGCDLVEYNGPKVLKRCNKILKRIQEIQHIENAKTESGRKELMKGFRKYSKKDLKKELKKRNIPHHGLDKSEMLEVLEEFL